jgi:hypothetical protein
MIANSTPRTETLPPSQSATRSTFFSDAVKRRSHSEKRSRLSISDLSWFASNVAPSVVRVADSVVAQLGPSHQSTCERPHDGPVHLKIRGPRIMRTRTAANATSALPSQAAMQSIFFCDEANQDSHFMFEPASISNALWKNPRHPD